jgi:hypothetical protein
MGIIQKHVFKGFENKIKHVFKEHHERKENISD